MARSHAAPSRTIVAVIVHPDGVCRIQPESSVALRICATSVERCEQVSAIVHWANLTNDQIVKETHEENRVMRVCGVPARIRCCWPADADDFVGTLLV